MATTATSLTGPAGHADTSHASEPASSTLTSTAQEHLSAEPQKSNKPIVLFDSYHAHNFLHRGLAPGEYVYHRFSGFRRAAQLLEARGCEVEELLIGPLTKEKLSGVSLVVLNLPSMDRPSWLVSEILAVEEYIRGGGGMLFITDHSNCYYHQYHLLPLWERLELIPTFETTCERDPKLVIATIGAGWMLIKDFAKHPVTADLEAICIQSGGRVVGDGIVARTSPMAWADAGQVPLYGEGSPGLTGDLKQTDNEEQGAQGVVLAREIGRGRVVVIVDQNAIGDACITYADNWRLWLNATSWCGQFDAPARETSILAHRSSAPIDSADGSIDEHLSRRLDQRNTSAAPKSQSWIEELDAGSKATTPEAQAREAEARSLAELNTWSVHCWEPTSRGKFYWGGLDRDQFYGFIAWLNRWRWTSAGEKLEQPAEVLGSRPLLLAFTPDLADPFLQSAVRDALAQGGKVVFFPEPIGTSTSSRHEQPASEAGTPTLAEDASYPVQPDDTNDKGESITSLEPGQLAAKQLHPLLERLSELQFLLPSASEAAWQPRPIPHWTLRCNPGTLVILASSDRLANAHFLAPNIAPDGATLNWETSLRKWLYSLPAPMETAEKATSSR